jgi:hypothetical protein
MMDPPRDDVGAIADRMKDEPASRHCSEASFTHTLNTLPTHSNTH